MCVIVTALCAMTPLGIEAYCVLLQTISCLCFVGQFLGLQYNMKHNKISDVNEKLFYSPQCLFLRLQILHLCCFTFCIFVCDIPQQKLFGRDSVSNPCFSSTFRPHTYSQVRIEYCCVTCTYMYRCVEYRPVIPTKALHFSYSYGVQCFQNHDSSLVRVSNIISFLDS